MHVPQNVKYMGTYIYDVKQTSLYYMWVWVRFGITNGSVQCWIARILMNLGADANTRTDTTYIQTY